MPLIELICTKCGLVKEELIKADGNYPDCPSCGHKRQQKYSGVKAAYAKGTSCKGSCRSCRRCGK